MSEKLIILLLSGTLLMTGVMALSWEPGRDRTLTPEPLPDRDA